MAKYLFLYILFASIFLTESFRSNELERLNNTAHPQSEQLSPPSHQHQAIITEDTEPYKYTVLYNKDCNKSLTDISAFVRSRHCSVYKSIRLHFTLCLIKTVKRPKIPYAEAHNASFSQYLSFIPSGSCPYIYTIRHILI